MLQQTSPSVSADCQARNIAFTQVLQEMFLLLNVDVRRQLSPDSKALDRTASSWLQGIQLRLIDMIEMVLDVHYLTSQSNLGFHEGRNQNPLRADMIIWKSIYCR